jgi:hypothetical protein
MENIGSVVIHLGPRHGRVQFFWEGRKGFMTTQCDKDGSTRRVALKSAKNARMKAWNAAYVATQHGFKAEAFAFL